MTITPIQRHQYFGIIASDAIPYADIFKISSTQISKRMIATKVGHFEFHETLLKGNFDRTKAMLETAIAGIDQYVKETFV